LSLRLISCWSRAVFACEILSILFVFHFQYVFVC